MMLQIWLVWTLVWAIVGANLLAFLMSVTSKEVAGTQFSIYMTLINVGAFTGNALSPQLLDVAGGSFPNLFPVRCSLPSAGAGRAVANQGRTEINTARVHRHPRKRVSLAPYGGV